MAIASNRSAGRWPTAVQKPATSSIARARSRRALPDCWVVGTSLQTGLDPPGRADEVTDPDGVMGST